MSRPIRKSRRGAGGGRSTGPVQFRRGVTKHHEHVLERFDDWQTQDWKECGSETGEWTDGPVVMLMQQYEVLDEYNRQIYIKIFGCPPPPPPEPLTEEERNDRRKATAYRGQAARRARLLDAKVIERIDRYAIWDRDRGICHICTKPADRDNFHLDHVKALALGGDHSYANLRVAHPVCNMRKGATPWPTAT